MRYADALAGVEPGWAELPFFRDGSAAAVLAAVDAKVAGGARVLPGPQHVFEALRRTPRSAVRAVILGQDPYPTPGHAHGLAFSYSGSGRLPASLGRILDERDADVGAPPSRSGHLGGWADQGVLLLNTALTVEAGRAGGHLRLGWQALARQAVAALGGAGPAVAFILWGGPARAFATEIDRGRHGVIESAHPSPLAARGDFRGSRPFSRANAFLTAAGRGSIDWQAGPGEP